jgi:HAE1 family hydrophobic/amphiphilic exporter-1
MKVIQNAIRFPVTTTVSVVLLILFGAIALFRIPVQLTPNVEDPEINVETIWPGASPQEIEREIVDEQEEQLKSLEGLVKMESSSSDSRGTIALTFQTGTDLDAALLRVSNRLDQVPSYPSDVEKPVLSSSNENFGAIAWFAMGPLSGEDGFRGDISTLLDYADDNIKPAFERIPGVSRSNIYGGREREMQVIVDPAALAARQVTMNELASAIDRENNNFSGGDFDEGKRRYIVRTVGEYQAPEDIDNIVIAVRNGVPVYLRDVARAELGHRKAFAQVFQKRSQILAMNIIKEPGANVLEVMEQVRVAAEAIDRDQLAPMGLELTQVYDETEYINSAISLVRQSIMIGGFLAIMVLLMYLRSISSTIVIAVAIPISIVGSILMMFAFGRTLNVISLAGMAFAVGMVVDNAIVVLENIYRHRQMGKPRAQAAFDGAREVWGAVLASTLTTIAVFVPVVFIKEEVGQLFGDIAIAISCAVALSLIIAITVIPSMSAKVLGGVPRGTGHGFKNLWGGVGVAVGIRRRITGTVAWIIGARRRQLAVIVGLTVIALGSSWLLMPKTEYLPLGNNNFLFGLLLPPPGYSLEEMASMNDIFVEELEHLWDKPKDSPQARELSGGGVHNYFYVALNQLSFMGARANDPLRVRELIPEFRRINGQIPGSIFIINQSSIFQRGAGQGRNIDIELTGPDLGRLIALGGEVFGRVNQVLPGAQARPIPSLDLGNPEVQVRTHRRRASEKGISNRDLGFAVSALVDGIKVSEFQHEGRAVDLRIMAEEGSSHRTHLLEQLPVATPTGELVTLGSVADIEVVNGPVTINHSERLRAVTIQVTPSEQTPLESAMDKINTEILGPIRDEGRLGGLYSAHLSGTADKLTQTWRSLRWNFLLALVITYLLMAALFENFVYPFVIMFSVPLAAMGGFLGLTAVNLLLGYQPLDTLTMLGFIILVGTVVNNAILIVHQSLNHIRDEGMNNHDAVVEAVRNRIRPIFMSVSTSALAMAPLVLFPGAGSELYRGLGSVVIGGLIVSTVFTVFLVPSLLSLMLDIRHQTESWVRRTVSSRRPADVQEPS